jgi:hypothetical protein
MKVSLMFVCIFNLSLLNAQSAAIERMRESDFIAKNNTIDMNSSNVRGNRYFNEEYCAGMVIMKDKSRYTTEMVYKFDEFKNSVQVMIIQSKKELSLFNHLVDTFKLFMGNETVVYSKAFVPEETDINKFYRLIYSDSVNSLIKLTRKKIVKVSSSDVFNSSEMYDQFESQDVYYIKIGNVPYQKIKISKKSFFDFFPSKKNALTRLFDLPKFKGNLTDSKLESLMQSLNR